MSVAVMTIDTENKYDYVLDKGPLTDFQLSDDGTLQSISSLRVFGLRKGFTEFAELPGHYLINTWTGAEADGAQLLQAPALVHFKDRSLAPAFVLEWRAVNDKLYGQVLATAVKVGNGHDPDKKSQWLSAADVRPYRLALIESVQPVANRDGAPLKKNLEQWLAEHSGERRKVLGLTSFKACSSWCEYNSFASNTSAVVQAVQASMEKSVREGSKQGQAKQIDAAIAKQLKPMLRIADQLAVHLQLIGVPLTHRLVELELDPEVEVHELQHLVWAALSLSEKQESEKAKLLLDLLTKGEKFRCMQSGKCEAISSLSPLHEAHASSSDDQPQEDRQDEASPAVIRQLEFDGETSAGPPQNPTADGSEMVVDGDKVDKTPAGPETRKQRVATQIFEPTARVSKKVISKQPNKTKGERRPYKKSGLFSKDPIKAAMALEKLKEAPLATGGPSPKAVADAFKGELVHVCECACATIELDVPLPLHR